MKEGGMFMTNEKFIGFTMEKTKHIALVAHDGKKKELVEWCDRNKDVLKNHFLCGTGTTAKLIAEKTGLPVKGYCSGPLGGDQQIGSRIVEGGIDFLVFLWDPLEHSHMTRMYGHCFVSQWFMIFRLRISGYG